MSAPVRGFVARNNHKQLCFFAGRPEDLAEGVVLEGTAVYDAVAAAPEIAHDADVAAILAESLSHAASIIPGPTGHPYNTTDEHRSWVLVLHLRAGGDHPGQARRRLKALLIEWAREEALELAIEATR